MSWDDLHSEISELFDGYSWREDDTLMAMERWSAARCETVRAGRRAYSKTHKPWLRPENREKDRLRRRRQRARLTAEQKAVIAAKRQAWGEKNREKTRAASRRWREKNRNAEAERVRAWREANRGLHQTEMAL